MTTSVQKRYPVRYWVTLLYFVGMPNFLHFDPTGRTQTFGLFNLTSLTDIVYTGVATAMLLALTMLSREGLFVRRIRFDPAIWGTLLLSVTVATVLQPDAKFAIPKSTDIFLSLYRIWQWILGVLLLLSLYSRESEEEAPAMLIQLIARMCWANLITIFVMAPIVPSLAFVSEDAQVSSIPRLGGVAMHPGGVALAASVTFLHSLILLRGSRRFIGCAISFVALVLTYTRSAQVVFLVSVLIYALFLTRNRALRWVGIAVVFLSLAGGVALHSTIQQYLSRGQSQADVESFGGRVATWQTGMEAFYERPLLGYGFVAGPKNAMRDHWSESHWIPPHAHNDFVQAFMSGGIITGFIVIWLYLYTFYAGCRRAPTSPGHAFIFLVFFQVFATGMVSTNLTTGFGKPALFFVVAYLLFVVEGRKKTIPAQLQSRVWHGAPFLPGPEFVLSKHE
jgi:O-antigen ligase